MEINAAAIEEISDGNSVCKLCFSYLTLGKNDEIKRDNLHVHFNGRKHKFLSLILKKSCKMQAQKNFSQPFSKTELFLKEVDVLFLYENGISNHNNCDFSFYCNFCDCKLPHLSKDRRLNVFNVKAHLRSKRHNFNVLFNLTEHINVEYDYEVDKIFMANSVEPVAKILPVFTSVTAPVYSSKAFSVEKILSEVPSVLQDHKHINYNETRKKLHCSLCDCFIGVSCSRVNMINNISRHIKGKKHQSLSENGCKNNIVENSLEEIKDTKLKNVIKLTKIAIIDKNEKYICRNSCDNIVCKLCQCVLPNIGKGGYLFAVRNFQLHFTGKKHSRLVKNDANEKMIDGESKDVADICDETILQIFNEILINLPKDNVYNFMISKFSNLVCKICSCALCYDVELSSNKQLANAIETHIQTQKHIRLCSDKESVKNYNAVIRNIKPNLHFDNKNNSLSSYNSLRKVIKLDSCGQLVCSTCQKIIVPKNCKLKMAVMCHLKGKRHKFNTNSQNILTKNVLNDVLDSLPSNYKINKKYLSFIFSYGIVNCKICDYMFTVYNDYRLRNNLIIHIQSVKHNKLLECCEKFIDEGVAEKHVGNNYLSQVRLNGEKIMKHILEFIPKSLHFNVKFLSLRSNGLFCNPCGHTLSCTTLLPEAVEILTNHFLKDLHKKKVGRFDKREILNQKRLINFKIITEKNLNNLFENQVPKNIAHNRQYIKIISGKLFCNICQCNLLDVENSNKIVVEKLKSHFTNNVHVSSVLKCINFGKEVPNNVLVKFESYDNVILNDKFEEKYVRDLFSNFIKDSFQFNQQYISYDKKLERLSCNLCCYIISLDKRIENTVYNLKNHFNEIFHTYNLQNRKISEKASPDVISRDSAVPRDVVDMDMYICEHGAIKDNEIVDENSTSVSSCISDSTWNSKEFLNRLFTDHVDRDLHFNKNHIEFDQKQFVCRICNCQILHPKDSIAAGRILSDHLKCTSHENNLFIFGIGQKKLRCPNNDIFSESDEKFLDDLFAKYIERNIQFNRQFIIIQESSIILCSICKCGISKSNDPEVTAKTLSNHLNGAFHESQLKSLKVKSESLEKNPSGINNADYIERSATFLDRVFTNLIQHDYQMNRKYIILNTSDFFCQICEQKIEFSTSCEIVVLNIMNHLKGNYHQGMLKKSDIRHENENVSIEARGSSDGGINSIEQDKRTINNKNNVINELFANFIPEEFHFNEQFVTAKSNKIVCNLCNCQMSFVSLRATAINLLSHLKGNSHKINLNNSENVFKTLSTKSSSSSNATVSLGKSTDEDEIYIDDMFRNEIPSDLQFNQKHISMKLDKLFCNICNWSVQKSANHDVTAKHLIKHLNEEIHKSKLKQNKVGLEIIEDNLKSSINDYTDSSQNNPLFLIELFSNFIPQEFQFHRPFISVKSNELVCSICYCTIFKPVCNQVTADMVLEHIKGFTHEHNLKKRILTTDNICENKSGIADINSDSYEAYLDNVFTNFIKQDFQFNKQYIYLITNKLACRICNCILFEPATIPMVTAVVLMEHLKGIVHKNNLKAEGKNGKEYVTSCININDNSVEKHAKYLDDVFKISLPKFSDVDFQLNKKNIVLRCNKLVCTLCDCTVSDCSNSDLAAKNLFEHFVGAKHVTNSKIQNVDTSLEINCSSNNNIHKSYNSSIADAFVHSTNSEFQLNVKYVGVESSRLVCKLCGVAGSQSGSRKELENCLKGHLQEKIHKSHLENIVKVGQKENLDETGGCDIHNSFKEIKLFLDSIYANLIHSDLSLSRQFITVESNYLLCILCNSNICSISSNSDAVAKYLRSHLKGSAHTENLKIKNVHENSSTGINTYLETGDLKFVNIDGNLALPTENSGNNKNENFSSNKDRTFLNEIFKKFIPYNLQFNRQYVCIKSYNLFCNVCNCGMYMCAIPEVCSKALIQHFKGGTHLFNLKMGTANESNAGKKIGRFDKRNNLLKNPEKFLDYLFENFFPLNFQFNRRHFISKSDKFVCSICNWMFSESRSPQIAAQVIAGHIKSSIHNKNLKRLNKLQI